MKTGMDLDEFAQTIKEHRDNSRDFLADTRSLELSYSGSGDSDLNEEGRGYDLVIENGSREPFFPTENAHRQIGSRLGIPRKFYKRLMRKYPNLLTKNVNKILHKEPQKRLVRTLYGDARAFLSDRYRRIDNYDAADIVLPVLEKQTDMNIKSCNVSMEKMHIKAIFPDVEKPIKKGDSVQAGICIENSEVGCGSLRFQPLVYRKVCSNGLIVQDKGVKQVHAGSSAGFEDSNMIELSEETKRAEDKLLMHKIGDILDSIVNGKLFDSIVHDMKKSQFRSIDVPMDDFVEELGDGYNLRKGETSGVLEHLACGGDLSQYGASNSITRTAQDVDSYDRSTELQKIGGKVLEMSEKGWKQIAQ